MICKERLWKQATLSIEAPLGNVEDGGGGSFTVDFERGPRAREICKRRLWKQATLSIEAPLGNVEGGLIYRGL
jgi:hypothetical protein